MFELGESLAAARRRQGLELPAVEAATCIRAKHLASLEHERFDALPGRAYARAFLKGYADFLGLETALFLEEFDARWPEEEVEVAPVRIPRRRHVPVGFLLVAAATALILGFVAWSGSGSGSSPKDVGFPAASPPRARAASHPVARHVTRRARPTAQDTRLVIRATRGNCWLLVRRGDENGPVLWEGTLTRGSVVRFVAKPVWVRLGAPSNVDVHRGATSLRNLPRDPTNVVA